MVFPIKNNKIVLSRSGRSGYCDHPKYIVEEIFKRDKEYDLVWLVDSLENIVDMPKYVRVVRNHSLKSIYELATARIWIDVIRKYSYVVKRSNQYYIQLWHGFGPKNVFKDGEKIPLLQRKSYLRDSRLADLYVSNNKLLSSIYRNDFWYDGVILESGFPRNDILLADSDKVTRLRNKLGIKDGIKIVMYAPTFRLDMNVEWNSLDYLGLISFLSHRFSSEWVVLLRLHPMIADKVSLFLKENKNLIDVSNYIDMQHLLLISDVLITDYSSCMFDFSVLRRPCFLYVPDIGDVDTKQGFCIQPENLPFPRAHSNEELQTIIENFDEESYVKTLNEYLDSIGMCDNGTASKAVVDWIEEKINANKKE